MRVLVPSISMLMPPAVNCRGSSRKVPQLQLSPHQRVKFAAIDVFKTLLPVSRHTAELALADESSQYAVEGKDPEPCFFSTTVTSNSIAPRLELWKQH